MNKIWLAVLLVPYVGFAQNSFEFLEEVLMFDEEVAVKDTFEEELATPQKPLYIVKKQHKEPVFCAYCGSSLIALSEEESVKEEESKEVAVSEKAPVKSKKRTAPAIGAKSSSNSSKLNESSERPRVTHRKNTEKVEAATVESSKAVSESETPSRMEKEENNNQVSSTQLPKRAKSAQPVLGSKTPAETAPKSSTRPKVTQRKQLSSVEENASTPQKGGRFAPRNKTRPTAMEKRASAQTASKKEISEKGQVAKKSPRGSRAQIKESMSYHPSQEE